MVPANARTIKNLPGFPLWHLKTSVSASLYKSLLVSPVTAWVIVKAPEGSGSAPQLIRSDAGGVFDELAKTAAKDWGGEGFSTIESRVHRPSLMVHLLIYKLPDGLMAVNFAHNDESSFAGNQYTDVYVGVYKDGKWTRIGGNKVIRRLPQPGL